MARKLLLLMLMIGLLLAFAGVAMAQTDDDMTDDDDTVDDDDITDDDMVDDDDATDDDTADDDAVDDDTTDDDDSADLFTLDFDAPEALEPDTTYNFEFTVFNNTVQDTSVDKGEWIKRVDLSMPSENYVVDDTNLDSPDPLHGSASEGEYQIDHWGVEFDADTATITWQAFGVVTSAEYGDIREQELLTFAFTADTDASATDGFAWTLYGDLDTEVTGVAFIGEQTDDDDDTSDDDSDLPKSSSDDDDSGGCGC